MWKLCVVAVLAAGALANAQDKRPARAGGDERAYERGQRALDRRNWDEAVDAFQQAAAGSRADAALYWIAYGLNKLGRREQALAMIEKLRTTHAGSRWLDDAKALELEIRQAAGQKLSPDAETDDDLKLMALNSLLHSDPDRALPLLEKILKSSASPKLKERAVFVLAQSGSPKAREVLAQVARGGANPDVQLRAINFLAAMGGKTPERQQLLSEIYASSTDLRVKRAVLQGFMMGRDRDRLLDAAKTEKNPELRREAINMLGASGGQAELWGLYRAGVSAEEKQQLLVAMMAARDVEHITEIAKSDADKAVRRRAIQMMGAVGGENATPALLSLYASESDAEVKRAIVDALGNKRDARVLVELARKENDPQLKRAIVERLSTMRSKEATDYMLEILNK